MSSAGKSELTSALKEINLKKYEDIEAFYDKKIMWAMMLSTLSGFVTMFGIGLAVASMILDAKQEITDLFILIELSFLILQILFSLAGSYFRKKKLENYYRAEKEMDAKVQQIKKMIKDKK